MIEYVPLDSLQTSISELEATVTISNNSAPPLKSKQVLGIGSHSAAGTLPEAESAPQSPPTKAISQASPSDKPVIVIIPSATEAGSSPPTVPAEAVVTSVIAASDPV